MSMNITKTTNLTSKAGETTPTVFPANDAPDRSFSRRSYLGIEAGRVAGHA